MTEKIFYCKFTHKTMTEQDCQDCFAVRPDLQEQFCNYRPLCYTEYGKEIEIHQPQQSDIPSIRG